ncbi:MAG: hypothetical protein WCP03_00175 [Candidatus Saccharibacteria bacterium]
MEQSKNHEILYDERLISSDGDESLASVKYFLHGTASLANAENIKDAGFTAREGRATISTDLAHSLRWAMGENKHFSESETSRNKEEVGKIFIIKKPLDYRVDYGLYTDAIISGDEITGFPLKYVAGRKQLAFYKLGAQKDELANLAKDQRDKLIISAEQIELVIEPTKELLEFVEDLSEKTKRLERISIDSYSQELARILKLQQNDKTIDDLEVLSHQLIVTTIESIVISKLRNLQLDVFASKGYKIFENSKWQARDRNLVNLKKEITELYDKSYQKDFDIGIEWLNKPIITKTELLFKAL